MMCSRVMGFSSRSSRFARCPRKSGRGEGRGRGGNSSWYLLFWVPLRLSLFFLFLWSFRHAPFLFGFTQSSLSHRRAAEGAVRDGSNADCHVTATGWTDRKKKNWVQIEQISKLLVRRRLLSKYRKVIKVESSRRVTSSIGVGFFSEQNSPCRP